MSLLTILPENDPHHPEPALHGSHHQPSSPFGVFQLAIQDLLIQQQFHLVGVTFNRLD